MSNYGKEMNVTVAIGTNLIDVNTSYFQQSPRLEIQTTSRSKSCLTYSACQIQLQTGMTADYRGSLDEGQTVVIPCIVLCIHHQQLCIHHHVTDLDNNTRWCVNRVYHTSGLSLVHLWLYSHTKRLCSETVKKQTKLITPMWIPEDVIVPLNNCRKHKAQVIEATNWCDTPQTSVNYIKKTNTEDQYIVTQNEETNPTPSVAASKYRFLFLLLSLTAHGICCFRTKPIKMLDAQTTD